jgi:putative inorganic carbon (hco3(-)) transporter
LRTAPQDPRDAPRPHASSAPSPARGVPPDRALGAGTWVVILYLILDYGKPQFYLHFLEYLKPGLWIAIVGAAVIFVRPKHRLPREAWLVLAFLAVMALDVPFAINPRHTYNAFQLMLQMMLSGPFVMMVALDDVRRLRAALWTYVLVGSYQGIQGLLHGGVGVGGLFVDENDLCMLAATVIPLAFFLGMTAGARLQRMLGFSLMVVNILAAVVSFSRGGFLALCAVFLCIILRSRRPVSTLLLIAVALAVVYPLAPPAWFHEMGTIESSTRYGDTGEQRLYMWGIAFKVFLVHPVLGVGGGDLGRWLPEYEDPTSGHTSLWGRVCHSVYLTLLAESGVVGSAVWVWLVAGCFLATASVARKLKGRNDAVQGEGVEPPIEARALVGACRGLEAALLGFLVAGVFLTVNYYPVMWTLVGFVSAARLSLARDPALARWMAAPAESS